MLVKTFVEDGMPDLSRLEKKLGVSFQDRSLLKQALVHDSYVNENPALAPVSNERLEFLGDAILDMIIAEKLYYDYPRFTEGQLTFLRASLVRKEALNRVARFINLGDFIYLGKGEEASGGRLKPANLSDALEALIAAVYIDQGFEVTRQILLRLYEKELQQVVDRSDVVDYKSQLQELVQARMQETPVYELVEAVGPDHNKLFTVEVKVGGLTIGKGSGKSKKIAETEAAQAAWQKLSNNFTP